MSARGAAQASVSTAATGAQGPEAGPNNTQAWLLDDVVETLISGEITGTAVRQEIACLLAECLIRVSPAIDKNAFASALPVGVKEFGVEAICQTLSNLGIRMSPRRLPAGLLASAPAGTLVLQGSEPPCLLELRDGRVELYAPGKGKRRALSAWTAYVDALVPEIAEPRAQGRPKRDSLPARFAESFRRELLLAACTSLMSVFLIVAASASIGVIFDNVLPALALDTLIAMGGGVILLAGIELFIRNQKANLLARMAAQVEYKIATESFSSVLNLPQALTLSVTASEQRERLEQYRSLRDVVCGPFISIAFDIPIALLLLICLSVISLLAASIVAALLAFFTCLNLILTKRFRRLTLRHRVDQEALTRAFEEVVENLTQIRQRGLESVFNRRLLDLKTQALFSEQTAARPHRILMALRSAMLPVILGTVVLFGALEVMTGSMSAGALVMATIMTTRLVMPFQNLVSMGFSLRDSTALFEQIKRLIDLSPETNSSQRPAAMPASLVRGNSAISFENVTMKYPDLRGSALHNIGFELPAGQVMAVVGHSGSGKSTLLRIATGQLHPTGGTVRLSGKNIQQYSADQITSYCAYIQNNRGLLPGTIRQNLLAGIPGVSQEEIWQVLSNLGLSQEIKVFPDGLDTKVQDTTIRSLPASFPMRLALARALLARPCVIALDEPESGLGQREFDCLLSVLDDTPRDIAYLIATQRPTLMQKADQVLKLSDGVASGPGFHSNEVASDPAR